MSNHCTVLLTFDFDAELLWAASYPDTPAYRARGHYGARVGVPRVLELLAEHAIRATFFVPGINAERYPDLVRDIHNRGHEIGHHGYLHEYVTKLTPTEERSALAMGADALQKVIGVRPQGYRSPAWDLTDASLQLFREFGFRYDSSMMADDFQPYLLEIPGGAMESKTVDSGAVSSGNAIVELPVSWELDDAPYFLFNFHPYRAGLAAPSQVYEIWQSEFDGAYAAGGVFTLTMHPQIIGRYHRIQLLDRLIRYIKCRANVTFGTCGEVAARFQP
ncbi:MAG TPA: polysaccharide deacetylase [Caldilineaceae bacterium]|nr:polysaccharide deacetylase [Caldilineaceae bacterium]